MKERLDFTDFMTATRWVKDTQQLKTYKLVPKQNLHVGRPKIRQSHLQRCNSRNELIKVRVDSPSESWVSRPQFHVFIAQKPAGHTRTTTFKDKPRNNGSDQFDL